mgnify:CR=1 FL=1
MRSLVRTTAYTRGQLPHWEVEGGRYFVTVRCHDSLPREAISRLGDIHDSLQAVEHASLQFAQLQRTYFLTMEKYLDAGSGASPLRDPRAASALVRVLDDLPAEGAVAAHYTIMPNHWHALLAPIGGNSIKLHRVMARLKGRSARAINLVLGRSGPLWQREWFDRWMRNDTEWNRCAEYIRNNPVKVGLVRTWQEHLWTK